MSILRSSIAAAMILGLGACAERAAEPAADTPVAPAQAPPEDTAKSPREPLEVINFLCGDTAVEARYYDDGAVLHVDGEEIALSAVVAASGARYASGSDPAEIEFWSRGLEAMLTMRGTRYPTCRAEGAGPASTRYRALGQEPGWALTWWGDGVALVLAADNRRIEGTAPARSETGDGWSLSAETDHGLLSMQVAEGRLCRDSMSGMPHPDSVSVQLGDTVLHGCGGDPAQLLRGQEWRLQALDGDAVLAEPMATLNFLGDGQVAGRATCNSFSARYELSGEGLRIGPIVATKMACLGEGIMEQESRFLDILGKAARFDIDADGTLVVHAADGRGLRAARD